MKRILIILFISLIAIATVSFIFYAQNKPTYSQVIFSSSDQIYLLQKATTPEQRETGLMNVLSLDDDKGMIFIFPDNQFRTFWMKDTFVSLDIIFISEDKKVINFYESVDTNQTRVLYKSTSPARYAIELKGGQVAKNHIKSGDSILIVN